jgi:hypothetical protein
MPEAKSTAALRLVSQALFVGGIVGLKSTS